MCLTSQVEVGAADAIFNGDDSDGAGAVSFSGGGFKVDGGEVHGV